MEEKEKKVKKVVEKKDLPSRADLKKVKKGKSEKVEEKIEGPKVEVKIAKENISDSDSKKDKSFEAVINIYTSFNNTVVHVTDMAGKTLAKVTGGMVTKHSRLKANPTVAMFIAKRVAETLKELRVKNLYVRIRAKTRNPAPGPGAHSIMKSLSREGFRILNILDTTRNPRGGPKKKGGRRGRRP